MNQLLLSLVVPAHNEEKNLPPVLKELVELLAREQIPCEIIVVNDCSSDGTAAVVADFKAHNADVRLVTRTGVPGFGRAIRAGLEQVQGDVVIIYMADCSDNPRDAVRYYRKLEEGYDCVFGSRFIRGSTLTKYPLGKLVANRLVNRGIQLLFQTRFNDLTNAFKAYRKEVIASCGPYQASHYNITIEMSLSALVRNYSIAQIPIEWHGRSWGSSHLRLTEMGRRYLSTLLKIFFERLLIADDLIAELVYARTRAAQGQDLYLDRIRELEQRLAEIEKLQQQSRQ